MNIALFEDSGYRQLLPLVWLRAGFELRCGRDCLIDKIRAHAGGPLARVYVRPELEAVARERIRLDPPLPSEPWCLLNARLLVTGDLKPPPVGAAWHPPGALLAATVSAGDAERLSADMFLDDRRLAEWAASLRREEPPSQVRLIEHPWDLVLANDAELRRQCGDGGVHVGEIHPAAHLVQSGRIHVAARARIKPGVVLDAESGPIHIDRDALIESNAVVQGPCAIGAGSIVRPGAVLRGGVSVGPVCKVGGEIEASIFQGYANKQHDGFLGHSFVGSWVNLGADTVTSDLKNTYGTIRVSLNGRPVESGQHFVGSFIADHAKTGIGTILPTGCVIGVAANVFTRRPVPKFVPSFAWLTDEGLTAYQVDRAIRIAQIVMSRRDVHLSDAEAALLARTAELARAVEAAGWA